MSMRENSILTLWHHGANFRLLLMRTVEPVILCGAEIWDDMTRMCTYRIRDSRAAQNSEIVVHENNKSVHSI